MSEETYREMRAAKIAKKMKGGGCDALNTSESYRVGRACPNRPSVLINGLKLCGRHASIEALSVSLKTGASKLLRKRAPILFSIHGVTSKKLRRG